LCRGTNAAWDRGYEFEEPPSARDVTPLQAGLSDRSSSHEALPLIAPCARRLSVGAQERPASGAALRFSAAGERPLARPGRRPMSSHYLDHHRLRARGSCQPEPCCCQLTPEAAGGLPLERVLTHVMRTMLGPRVRAASPGHGSAAISRLPKRTRRGHSLHHNSRALYLMAEARHSPRFISLCPALV
jgi:hypothetical protein